MSQLYLRNVIVTIIPTTGQPKRISELRIKFKCKKNEESKPNTMELEIYNLSKNTRTNLEGKNTTIILEAGYEDTTEVIFNGNVTKVIHSKEGPDIISKIELADGGNKYRNARISKGIPPGAKVKQVINELVLSMGLTQGPIIGVPNTQYANGITLQGLTKDRLDEVCKSHGLRWSIQDGAVQIVPENKTTLDTVVVMSPDTGLIGSPNKTKDGVEFKSLLQPVLKPGKRVKIESLFINGIFKIANVGHSGDSKEGDFITECEAFGGIN
jgi:hypothetical protein